MSFCYFAVYKPFGFLSQFSGEKSDHLLGELFDFPKDVYPIGRLDKDSEGLLILTNDNVLKHRLLDPISKHTKSYLVQVEGEIHAQAIELLMNGSLEIKHNNKNYRVNKAHCQKVNPPNLPDREPPIRFRANIPTSWIKLTLTEGKNRQVRKMTAAVGFPTLRLIRISIGAYEPQLQIGQVCELTAHEKELLLK
jgi:23S rRNA pseudouridine2457 synthase